MIATNEITNMEKYGNYKEQMGRLKKAMDNHFLLEALFIEYAIIEDRTESILYHSGIKLRDRAGLMEKLKAIRKLLAKGGVICKYIIPDMLEEIEVWSRTRNDMIHSLMKQNLTTDGLEEIVMQGQQIVKTLCSKTTSYKRALEREQKRMEEQIK